MSGEVSAADSSGALRLSRCADCGYALTGLPEEGKCPECGWAYSPQMIVLYGWPLRWNVAQNRPNRDLLASRLSGRSRMWAVSVFVLIMATAWLWSMLSSFGVRGYLLPMITLYATALLAVALWRFVGVSSGLPASHQVRLTPEGFAFRHGLGPVPLKAWGDKRRVFLKPLRPGAYWLTIARGLLAADCLELSLEPSDAERLWQQIGQWQQLKPEDGPTPGAKA